MNTAWVQVLPYTLTHMYRSHAALYSIRPWLLYGPCKSHTVRIHTINFENLNTYPACAGGCSLWLLLTCWHRLWSVLRWKKSLASHFRPIVTKFQQQGMSEAEIVSKPFLYLTTAPRSYYFWIYWGLYRACGGGWNRYNMVELPLKAKNTPSARDGLLVVCRFIIHISYFANGHLQIPAAERVHPPCWSMA